MIIEKTEPFNWADSTYKIEINPSDEFYTENGWRFHDFKMDMSLVRISGKKARKVYTPCYKKPEKEARNFFVGWCINDLIEELCRDAEETLSPTMLQSTLKTLGKDLESWCDKSKVTEEKLDHLKIELS